MIFEAAEFYRDPRLFPHRVSFDEDRVVLLPTSQSELRGSSFLDGRTNFGVDEPVLAVLSELYSSLSTTTPPPDRFIFHVSFCGSTLLSRLLDVEHKALVLREPQCLTDLAAYASQADSMEGWATRWPDFARTLRTLLRRRWEPTEPIVVKPSNWVNNLVPDLCANPAEMRPLFLIMERAAFLIAVFRGGSDRLAFAARAAVHFSNSDTERAALVATALAQKESQAAKLAMLAILAHHFQVEFFRIGAKSGNWGPENWLSHAELSRNPFAAAQKAAAALQLDLTDEQLMTNVRKWTSRHAKQPDLQFAGSEYSENEARITAQHGAAIETALRWADQNLP